MQIGNARGGVPVVVVSTPAPRTERFVRLDVRSSYARLRSPNTPLEYATTLVRQLPRNDRAPVGEPARQSRRQTTGCRRLA